MYQNTEETKQEIMTGTTIMALRTENGVILGADTRTSSGNLIVSCLTNKLRKITDRIYCCESGSAADTQVVCKVVINNVREIEGEEYPTKVTVKRVARIFRNILYRNSYLKMGVIVAGYDQEEGGSVYCLKPCGSLIKQEVALGGSGSLFLYGYVDNEMSEKKMDDKEKFEFVKKCIKLATQRDSASGGCIRLASIGCEGAEEFFYTLDNK
ncbi:Proteasome subunit beta type-6 [Cucumispora dikerogammari]|nr:Proteasome subunit beta type-6 [Cucumispora dikerogammari]